MKRPAAGLLAVLLTLVSCAERTPEPLSSESKSPASRIVTLAPHLAEMLFDVGAGAMLVGVSAYSDHPDKVLTLPVVSDAFIVDREQLAILEPDMLLAWQSGTPRHMIDQLREAGFRVESIKTEGLDDVAKALIRIGELTGNQAQAATVAARYRSRLKDLRRSYGERKPVRVFYQISQRPLYTINGRHYISELIELCGGINVFAEIGELAPQVDVEAVIDRNPEIMLAGGYADADPLKQWDRWPDIAANRLGNRFLLPADQIGRATTRLAKAADAVCLAIEQGRQNSAAKR